MTCLYINGNWTYLAGKVILNMDIENIPANNEYDFGGQFFFLLANLRKFQFLMY